MPIGIVAGLAIASAVGSTAASVYGANKQAGASKRAGQIEGDAAARAQEFEERKYNETTAAQKAQWDAEQQRKAPYRAAAAQIIGKWGGVPVESYQPTWQQPEQNGTLGSLMQPQARPRQAGTLGEMARLPYNKNVSVGPVPRS
jgi:hypothetical protein